MRINRLTIILLLTIVLMLGALAVPYGTGPSSAATLCVNPGGTGGCFSSIQAAVNAAMPGDTINVAAGTYTEQVQINKTLTLRGAKAGIDARTRAATGESIITFGDGPAQILADNVVIDGFTITGAVNNPSAPPFSALGAGIWTNPPFSGTQGGHQILNNIIEGNIIGMYLQNTGTLLTKVQFNLFQNNNAPGPAGGSGIYSDAGLQSALIQQNRFTSNDNTGVLLAAGPGSSGVTISQNEFNLNGNAVGLYTTTASSITQNNIHNQVFTQVAIDSSSSGLRITENFIQNGGTRGIRIGDFSGLMATSSNITANCNSISGNPTAGLAIDASADYTGALDAKNNWWGSASGPTIATNPGGTGDAIIDPDNEVVYTPFLTSSTDNSPADGFQCACDPPPANMTAWWPGEGNANDIIGGHNGTPQNGTGFAPGKVNQAFDFDGVDDFVSVPDSTDWDFPGDFTIDFWIKFDTIKNSMFLHQQSGAAAGGWEFDYQTASGSLIFATDPMHAAISTPWAPAPGGFYHLAVTRTGTTYRIYVDGAQLGINTDATAIANVTGNLRIGSWAGGNFNVDGEMDEIEIFSTRALSQAEIQAIVTAGSSGKCPCMITCPANITQCNDPNQCGAVVTYPAPTASAGCGTITCSPASGSFFPKGTTTVTCTTTAGPSCTFTVTVNDCQPPMITCPPNTTAITPTTCPAATSTVVTFNPPVASDNCPGVTTMCSPPSGSTFPVGTTTVTCTATDTSGNTATCSFTVTVFDVCLQDDSNPTIVLVFNSFTGDYRFCCNGTTFTGKGKITKQGCVITLEHNPIDRRVRASFTATSKAGNASLQAPPGRLRCTITDSNTANNTCNCQ